jgi:hypothetical protein
MAIPDRLDPLQSCPARDDFAQIMDELDLGEVRLSVRLNRADTV